MKTTHLLFGPISLRISKGEKSKTCELRNKKKYLLLGFPCEPVVKNPSAYAGDTSLVPGPVRSHLPWSS